MWLSTAVDCYYLSLKCYVSEIRPFSYHYAKIANLSKFENTLVYGSKTLKKVSMEETRESTLKYFLFCSLTVPTNIHIRI